MADNYSDPTPGDHDELLAELDRWPEGSSRAHAAAALRTEQSARHAAEREAAHWLSCGGVWLAERNALQQRIDAALALHQPVPWHEPSDGTWGVACSICDSQQYPCPTVIALTESKEPAPKLSSISSALSKATGLLPERIHNDRHPLDMD